MYDLDEAHMVLMNQALATEAGTENYVRDFVQAYQDIRSYPVVSRERPSPCVSIR
jgi:glutaconate CoA-transferase subunit A